MKIAAFLVDKGRKWWVPAAGGLLFLAIFFLRASTIPEDFYSERDDGVITLSHARNWVEYGFIGVNPSGGRLEGTSAPVQMLLYAALYALTGLSFQAYIQLQTLLCTFALGACFTGFFQGKPAFRLGAAALGAAILAGHTSFWEWHSSGMENALTHALFLATFLTLYRAIRTGELPLWQAAIPLFASLSRLESLYYIAPLLILFCGYWQRLHRNPKAYYFSALALCGWLAFTAWRYAYFGSLTPNTAVAQGINIMYRLTHWQASLHETADLSKAILLRHGILLLPMLAPLIVFSLYSLKSSPSRLSPLPLRERVALSAGRGDKRDREQVVSKPTVFLILMLLCVTLCAYFHPFFFGRARMDIARTTTQFALCTALAAAMLVYQAQTGKTYKLLAALPLLALAAWVEMRADVLTPYKIGWGVTEFERNLRDITRIAIKEHIPRPVLADADLGLISWQKQFNIVDLGKIGNPVIATLAGGRDTYAKIPDYLFAFAAPDIIESHSNWSCIYYGLYHDPRFRALYRPVWETSAPGGCYGRERLSGIWVRKDMLADSGSAERLLVDDLLKDLSPKRIEVELAKCRASGQGNCTYIARSAYRFLPEFRRRGTDKELAALFTHSPTPEFSRYLLTGPDDAQAYKGAVEEILRYESVKK